MGREIWGTYSVKDHMAPEAFLADLMFYDRLVLPVPEPDAESEWEKRGWGPARQAAFIEELEKSSRVKAIPWAIGTWDRERDEFAKRMAARPGIDAEAAQEAARDAFLFTRSWLIEDLPRHVRGVTTVPTFKSSEELSQVTGLRSNDYGEFIMSGESQAAAAMSLRFLVPKVESQVEPRDLKAVLERTGTKEHKKARDAFWRWQRDFFGENVITDQVTLNAAVEEMTDLVADLERAARWGRIKTVGQYLFLAGSVTVGMLGGPLTPIGVAGVTLTVGQFAFEKVAARVEVKPAPEAALFVTSKRGLPFKTAQV